MAGSARGIRADTAAQDWGFFDVMRENARSPAGER
jgi:hypothetical protein